MVEYVVADEEMNDTKKTHGITVSCGPGLLEMAEISCEISRPMLFNSLRPVL